MIKTFNLESGIEYKLIDYNKYRYKIKSMIAQGLNSPNIISILTFSDQSNEVFKLTTQLGTQNGFIAYRSLLFVHELKVIISASELTEVYLFIEYDY